VKKVVLRRVRKEHTANHETHKWEEILTAQPRPGEETPVVLQFEGAHFCHHERWLLGEKAHIMLTADEARRLMDVIRVGLGDD
jgi:hypothetical protein